MASIDEEKARLRRLVKNDKQKLTEQEKQKRSAALFRRLESLNEFSQVHTLMAYWAMPDEVQTSDFILKWYKHKRIILPAVEGDRLRLKIFSGMACMVPGEGFGIPEPAGEDFIHPSEIQLIIVPGIAFDRHNNRMGRGKAYYDNLLNTLPAFRVGVCYDFQYFEQIPAAAHDLPMNMVLTC
jgi:5-formyltetrahydrofolate cyclo-ligase